MKLSCPVNFILITFVLICVVQSFYISRRRRAAYDLPSGWDLIRNSLNANFECQDDGYFADVANGCQLFHVCQFIQLKYSKPRFLQHTFICGNGTVFNQLTQTCTYESQLSVPCESSQELFYMNKRIGELNTWFHRSEDYEKIRTIHNNNRFNAVLSDAQNSGKSFSNSLDNIDNDDNGDGFEDDF